MSEPMIAPDPMAPIPGQRNFYAESVYECHRVGITEEETRQRVEYKLRLDLYWQINRPWIDIITRVHAGRIRPSRLILNPDGSIKRVEHDWTARERQLLDDARQGLEQCAAQCGLVMEPQMAYADECVDRTSSDSPAPR